jgi:L-lactate dehydrogenase complex protein LldG
MNERETILGTVRAALPPESARSSRPPSPKFRARPLEKEASDEDRFVRLFTEAHGQVARDWTDLANRLRSADALHGYIDPALRETASPALSGLTLETEFDRSRVDAYAFGITRASGAIAETGSIILTGEDTPSRLAALAPWIHVAVIRRETLAATVIDAIGALGDDPSVVWVSGPSKTADIEGILVEGVHGPGVQMCLFC